MLRNFLLLPLLSFGLAGLASAQQTPSSAPPGTAPIEAGSDQPTVTIPDKPPRTVITEKKENGVTTEVDVKSGKSHYKLKPTRPVGNAVPNTVEAGGARAPQWTVMEFNLGQKKDKKDK
jgi:hypothetical protein